MPSPLRAILLTTNRIAKQNLTSENICPGCGECHRLIKWGFYTRYLFHSDDTIRIQRFRCLNSHCPRSTFSILPHPLLPIARVPLCFIMTLLSLYQDGCPVADLARKSGKSWSIVRRSLAIAKRIQAVLKVELELLLPCLHPAVSWTVFTHAFSWAIFPRRF
ncbi:MAG: hypothetical protein GY695_00025 [Aestuariibacter sp.]|nr:hypothetical protein [Aestuariibacter sp.]